MKSWNEIGKAATAVSSNPARRRTQMKIRMMLMTFISASCLSAMSTKDAPPSDYGVPTNSVVATPVGYGKRMTLDTGETVRCILINCRLKSTQNVVRLFLHP